MTQTDKILELLEKRGDKGVLNTELNSIAYRYSARVGDLRKQGHIISTIHVKDSIWSFVLQPSQLKLFKEV